MRKNKKRSILLHINNEDLEGFHFGLSRRAESVRDEEIQWNRTKRNETKQIGSVKEDSYQNQEQTPEALSRLNRSST